MVLILLISIGTNKVRMVLLFIMETHYSFVPGNGDLPKEYYVQTNAVEYHQVGPGSLTGGDAWGSAKDFTF